jgi:hypothetical protein
MGGGKTIQNGALKIIGDTITELGSANNFDISGRAKSA